MPQSKYLSTDPNAGLASTGTGNRKYQSTDPDAGLTTPTPTSPAATVATGASPQQLQEQLQAATQAQAKKQVTGIPMKKVAPLEPNSMATLQSGLQGTGPSIRPGSAAARMKDGGSMAAVDQAGRMIPQVAGAVAPAETFGPLAEGIGRLIPSAKRAAKAFEAVSAVAGDHPVQVTKGLSDSLVGIQQAVDAGSSMPMAVRKMIRRLADQEKGPLTYDEARRFYSNISNLSANETGRLNPNMHRLLGGLRVALNETITQTAKQAGEAERYQNAMREYRRVSQARRVGKYVKKAAAGAAGLGGAYEIYNLVRNAPHP